MKTRMVWWIGLFALALQASAQEIGYIESFSLASNREVALRELVPGTDEFYYYRALHAQNTGQAAQVREILERWIRERNGGVTQEARELLNRQALLDYGTDPQKSLAYLREQLGLYYPHARKTGERRTNAPTALDPAAISLDAFLARALAGDRSHLERIEDAGLELVAGRPITDDQRRNLLARLQRPDYPGLVDLIVADLRYRDSRGFGHHEIHRRLTLAQMDELLGKMPELRNQAAFVTAYLSKLGPEDEADLDTDAAAREAYYDRVWAFVSTLDPVHNSLKANVLYNRLRHDEQKGVYDAARFLEYVKLPRDVYYLRDEIRQQLPRGDYMARLNQSYGLVSLPPVANEEPLVRRFLLRFFVDAQNPDAYKTWIRDDFLKRLFAEAKVVNGVGDPQQWASLLTPDEFKRLKERVDIDFAPDNPEAFGAGDAVSLRAFVKNVPALIVKVYEINTANYYRETGRPLDLAINLDGLVASWSERQEYKEPPERRVARTFELPRLKGRGVYVVELIGNGKSSRALVQKGRLGVIQDVTAAGHAFTVLDEANRPLADARAWLAGREFAAGKDGRIVIPFTAEPGPARVVIQHGSFASLVSFRHLAEAYTLKAGLYVDRESLIRREKAPIAIRPVLLVNGKPTSLKLLEEPKLVIRSEDMQGIATEKELAGLELRESAETVREILVPESAVSLTVTLKARIQNLSLNRKEDLADGASFTLNGIERGLSVQDLHLSRTAGGYIVELRGRNGEPRPGEPLACWIRHRQFRDEWHTELQTDADGRARLGQLPGIRAVRIREPSGTEHAWTLTDGDCTYPDALHGRAGETLSLAVPFAGSNATEHASLVETRRGQFVKEWNGSLAMRGGFLELRELPAGDYSLYLKQPARSVAVRLTAGETRDGFTLSGRRALERPALAPLQVASVDAGTGTVDIVLANATPFTRVHVFATRYLPAYDVFARLGFTGAPALLQQPWGAARTFYESGRDIGDEYRYIIDRQTARKFPGNMLDRPGLLLNPWAIRDTEAQNEVLALGRAYGGRAAAEMAAAARAMGARGPGGQEDTEGWASLDFLKQPAAVLLNLAPDKEGRVRVARSTLAGRPQVTIVAADPTATILKTVALEDSPVATRELRMAAGLDPAKTFSEQKLVTPVASNADFSVADAGTARFETYDTVAKAYRLLATLGENPTFDEFSFVATWPGLPPAEKRKLYSKYACHELSFFLYHKDPEFFRAVIAPYLKNKKDKTFMDRWLLGSDLKGYLEPWRFGRLNAVERILLGKRLREQEPSLVRDTRERTDLIPPDIEDFNRRFDTALQRGALETGGGVLEQLEDMRRKAGEEAAAGLDAFAEPMAPPAPAAPQGGAGGRMDALRAVAAKGYAAAAPASAPAEAEGKLRERRSEAKDKKAEAEELELADAVTAPSDAEFFFADEAAKRQQTRRFFQKLEPTKEWAENNYYHLPVEQQLADLVTVNEFWADYAAHDGKAPFLSKSFAQATGSFTEMMLALAVLDLPFEAGAHAEEVADMRYSLKAASPLVMFHREIREAPRSQAPGGVLVAQHFFRADDRYRTEGNERFDKLVTDEFLAHVVYGAQVVLTNPSGNREKLQVLLQIPMGALPVNAGFYTRGFYVALEPYSTQTLEYYFYFPQTGAYPHYPVSIARGDSVVGSAEPFTFKVVESLTQIDRTSWAWISQNGTPEEALAFLDAANIHRLDLEEIAWRMRDAGFFRKATALLEARHVYHGTLWSYSVMHNDVPTMREYLRHSPFADRCGLALVSPLLTLEPVERLDYEHLEYAPLVNPRAHQIGAARKILNDRFRAQYQRFMKVLSYKAAPDDADELAVAYYMTLQDRVEEALAWFARVDRKAVPEQLQGDYLEAYLAFYQGDTERAKALAAKHAEEGVDRWRNRFALVLSQLEELRGGAAAGRESESRDEAQGALAATEPALDILVEAGKVRLDYRNLKACILNFYPMDIEVLFSRSPFLQDGAAEFSYIQPVLTRSIDLPAGADTLSIDLPAEFRTRNVMIEALGAGVRRTQAYYANTLRVQLIEAYGQLVVTHAETRKPVPGAYVKVYARRNGRATFFKDGYTDLRGRFDYASVNDSRSAGAERFAMLVLSDELGAVVREAEPPKP